MSDTKEQVLAFLQKCEELKKCKFIMATTKIKDILKSIVNCPELYMLFEDVTKDFDYPAARSMCFITCNDGGFLKSYVVLPKETGPRLAFIFCVFADIDRDRINFNEFLRKYFHEDGSYFESYHAFCATFVDALEEIIKHSFRQLLEQSPAETVSPPPESERFSAADSRRAALVSEISLAIAKEMQYVTQSRIPQAEKEGGIRMLEQIVYAVKAFDKNQIDALLCGYNYYILYHNSVSEGLRSLIESIAEFEETL